MAGHERSSREAVVGMLFVGTVLTVGCQIPRALSQFARPYQQRIDVASFTVAPPWVTMPKRVALAVPGLSPQGPAAETPRRSDSTVDSATAIAAARAGYVTKPAGGGGFVVYGAPVMATVLHTADGGVILVAAWRDPRAEATISPGDEGLKSGWEQILADKPADKRSRVRLIESKRITAFHTNVVYIYEEDGQQYTLAWIIAKGCLGMAMYTGTPSNPTFEASGFDRVVQSFRFEADRISFVDPMDRRGCDPS